MIYILIICANVAWAGCSDDRAQGEFTTFEECAKVLESVRLPEGGLAYCKPKEPNDDPQR